jgi:hypothetical protein
MFILVLPLFPACPEPWLKPLRDIRFLSFVLYYFKIC